MNVTHRGSPINGLLNLSPCIIKNTTAETFPSNAWLKVTGSQRLSTTDPGLLAGQEVILAEKFGATVPPVVCACGPVAIPAGKSGPGYMGSVMPIGTAETVGTRVKPQATGYGATADANGAWVVQIQQDGVGIIMHSPVGSQQPVNADPRIEFIATSVMADRKITVDVTWVAGNALHPVTELQLQVGDSLEVHDVHNKWSEAIIGATGMAYYHPAIADDPGTAGVDETFPAYWEIETCTLPINLVRCYLTACVKKTAAGGHSVEFKTDSLLAYLADGSEDDWRLSDYPNVDIPPEWTKDEQSPGGNYKYTLDVDNPFRLDGVSNTGTLHYAATIRRVVSEGPSDPENTELGKANVYSSTVTWELVAIDDHIARHVRGTIVLDATAASNPSSSANPVAFLDGRNPMSCSGAPPFDWFCAPPCTNGETACFWATYDPENDKYWIVSTDYAVMGKPKLLTLDPDLRIETDGFGNKSLCVDKFQFLGCDIADAGDSCVPLYECPTE